MYGIDCIDLSKAKKFLVYPTRTLALEGVMFVELESPPEQIGEKHLLVLFPDRITKDQHNQQCDNNYSGDTNPK